MLRGTNGWGGAWKGGELADIAETAQVCANVTQSGLSCRVPGGMCYGWARAAVGLLGDMADTMDQIQGLLGQRPDMPTFVRECQQHSDESIRQTAVWVEKCFRTKHGI